MKDRKRLLILICALIIANFYDYFITIIALKMGAIELNPIMRPIVANWQGAAIKLLFAPAMLLFYYFYCAKKSAIKRGISIVKALLIIYVLIAVIWNTAMVVILSLMT
ncbi:MAG TPA: hypothetical protein GX514_09160 [Thermoanaerobacterales bacterium]|nr:hypothetical protein [Thermoanaerobacterales bacterium]